MTAVHKRLAVNGGTIAAFTVAWSEPDNMPEWCTGGRYRELVHREFDAAETHPTFGEYQCLVREWG